MVGIVILVAGFGVYRWLDEDEERDRAGAAAEDFVAYCKRSGGSCEVERLDQMEPGLWRFQIRAPNGSIHCRAVSIEDFRFSILGEEGIEDTPCGPDPWSLAEANRRLSTSTWAKERNASLISCLGAEGGTGLTSFFRRFRCRYSSPHGDGVVVVEATGKDTFAVEPLG